MSFELEKMVQPKLRIADDAVGFRDGREIIVACRARSDAIRMIGQAKLSIAFLQFFRIQPRFPWFSEKREEILHAAKLSPHEQ
jgi:hypothetical protein